jgi:threonine aldolase
MIDLRSDTVTKPTGAMRKAIAAAEVGDDVLGDDPTIAALEARTAEMLGMEAAVYMPSGTMTNQVGIRCHTEPGDEILLPDNAHVFWYEAGAPGGISGVMTRMLPSERGIFTAQAVEAAMRPRNVHFAHQKLVCVENTSNRGGGSIWPIDRVAEVSAVARHAGLKMHLDGARLWNAAVASGVPESEYAKHFDSVSVCFSKGLGAPVGSALAGSAELIQRARKFRKMLGGGMRQAGIIAAGALYAVENHRERLAEDHAHARRLAEGIADLPGVELDLEGVETNIVLFGVSSMPAPELAGRLAERDVHVLATAPDAIRTVTNLMVTGRQIEQAVAAFRDVLTG